MYKKLALGLLLAAAGCMTLPEKNAALMRAVRAGDIAAVQHMLDRGANVNGTGQGPSPLQLAITTGRADLANLLISRGAELRVKNRLGDTPLHLAIKKNMSSTIQALITQGADVNAKGELDDSPLHVATYRRMDDVSAMLKAKGADETLLNRYGLRPGDMLRVPEIEAKVKGLAALLDASGAWTDRQAARTQFDHLKTLNANELTNALVLQTIHQSAQRLHVLLLAIKLGVPSSEQKLSDLLMVYGDKAMAEDYLNSGSSLLSEAGRKWANSHGYNVRSGNGSHRGSWGSF